MPEHMELSFSHVELRVADLESMTAFYAGVLGFRVTDRGGAPAPMVFLSASEAEHHQLVLAAAEPPPDGAGRLDHLAFRVPDLAALRRLGEVLSAHPGPDVATVSHGTTWSIYCRDPEGNRVEVFADTPWHVDQPCRFAIDLALSDRELLARTEQEIRDRPGFRPVRRRQALPGQRGGS